jgi:hypothetical protein
MQGALPAAFPVAMVSAETRIIGIAARSSGRDTYDLRVGFLGLKSGDCQVGGFARSAPVGVDAQAVEGV